MWEWAEPRVCLNSLPPYAAYGESNRAICGLEKPRPARPLNGPLVRAPRTLGRVDWLSLLLVAILGLLAWRGYANGFIRELVSLSAVILAIPVAGLLYDDLAAKLDPIVDNPTLSALLGFVGILAGVIIAGQVGAFFLKRTVEILNLGWVDSWAGGAFGFLKAFLVCQVMLIALVAFPRPDLRDEIDGSPVAGWLLDTAPAVMALLPGAFERGLDAFNQGIDIVQERRSSAAGE